MEKLSKRLWHIAGAILLIAVAFDVSVKEVGKGVMIGGAVLAVAIWVYREERKHARHRKVPARRVEEAVAVAEAVAEAS